MTDLDQGLSQGRDGLVGTTQVQPGQISGRVVAKASSCPSQALEAVVVEHHGLAVGGKAHIKLDSVAGRKGGLKCR